MTIGSLIIMFLKADITAFFATIAIGVIIADDVDGLLTTVR